MKVSFIGGGQRSTWRKPPTYLKSLSNFITLCCIKYTLACVGFELTTLVVIGIDCICSHESNYHMISTTMATSTCWRRSAFDREIIRWPLTNIIFLCEFPIQDGHHQQKYFIIRHSANIYKLERNLVEWVSDCCLMPTQQFFSYIMARTS
jgi:hypothetical protein